MRDNNIPTIVINLDDNGGISQDLIALEIQKFIGSSSFAKKKAKSNKIHCDKCGRFIPVLLPFFATIDKRNNEIICKLCEYLKTGVDPHKEAREYRIKLDEANRKKQMENQIAKVWAEKCLEKLKPYINIGDIAGSIRRKKFEVKDIELLVQPQTMEVSDGLFDTKQVRLEGFVLAVKSLGQIAKGDPTDGRYVKIVLSEGKININLDLFIPMETDYYRQLAIRTGSALFTKNHIADNWVKKGWRGTDDGLRLEKECDKRGDKWICRSTNPTLPPAWKSEKEFFEWLGTPYIEPEQRNL